ncbi:hypothetical protein LguiB_020976 [Lonicera macranthoides]
MCKKGKLCSELEEQLVEDKVKEIALSEEAIQVKKAIQEDEEFCSVKMPSTYGTSNELGPGGEILLTGFEALQVGIRGIGFIFLRREWGRLRDSILYKSCSSYRIDDWGKA